MIVLLQSVICVLPYMKIALWNTLFASLIRERIDSIIIA